MTKLARIFLYFNARPPAVWMIYSTPTWGHEIRTLVDVNTFPTLTSWPTCSVQ